MAPPSILFGMKSWLQIPPKSPFSLANIPFGIISTAANSSHRPAIAIGAHVLDLAVFASEGGFSNLGDLSGEQLGVFSEPTLNAFAALGRASHRAVRKYLQNVFLEETPYPEILRDNEALRRAALIPLAAAGDEEDDDGAGVQMHLPLAIGDYTDFYAGRNHARNVGMLFRDAANALQPNYNHLPVAYHGRASSVVVSGTPIARPRGQMLPGPAAKTPVFGASAALDLELEMGMFVCRPSPLASPVSVLEAHHHIFGYVLVNDWSARDIQHWEYVPLGPFNAKNFATSISPWVVLADALEPFRTKGLPREVELLPYLDEGREDSVFDVKLEVSLTSDTTTTTTIARTSSKNLLWSWPQMIAHHTVSGCNLRPGDLFGSGTISGPNPGTEGCMLEQTRGGKEPLKLAGGEGRKFLEDGDLVTITGWAEDADGHMILGFGECSGKIVPAAGGL